MDLNFKAGQSQGSSEGIIIAVPHLTFHVMLQIQMAITTVCIRLNAFIFQVVLTVHVQLAATMSLALGDTTFRVALKRIMNRSVWAFVLRIVGMICVAPVFIRATQLLFLGGTAIVQEAVPNGAIAAPPTAVQEPVYVAVMPWLFSLIVLIGFVQKRFALLWVGGIGLVAAGIMLLFSLGIYISFVGLFILILTFTLAKLTDGNKPNQTR
jgi:hypothetical protein